MTVDLYESEQFTASFRKAKGRAPTQAEHDKAMKKIEKIKAEKSYDPHYGKVYDTITDEEWGRKKKKAKKAKIAKGTNGGALVPVKKSRIVEMQKDESRALWLPKKDISHEPKPKEGSWWSRRKGYWGRRKEGAISKGQYAKKTGRGIQLWGTGKWGAHKERGAKAKEYAQPTRGLRGVTRKAGRTAAGFGYALPGPFQVWTLAWQKMSKALKTLAVIVFALVLLFVPWGVFYYAGWALGAAFMFLVSAIFWVFVSMFNAIAYALVAVINGVTMIFMSAIIFIVEQIFTFLPGVTKWDNGRELMANALIKQSQVANIPSLYHIVEPGWQSWMNNTIIGQVIGWFGVKWDLSWLVAPFHDLYTGLDAGQAVVLGCIIIGIPIVFLAVVYYKNRQYLR